MIDILAISHACFTGVNRAIYRELAARGWDVEIVVPASLPFAGGAREPDLPHANDPPLHRLPLTSLQPRLGRFVGLAQLLDARAPRIVLVDNDPNSRMAIDAGGWTRRRGAFLICQTCENLTKRWLPAAKRAGVRGLAGAMLTSALRAGSRPRVDHVFVISQDGQRVLEEQGYRSVSRIPLGFDAALFRPDAKSRAAARAQLGLTQPTVAYFGRLLEQKGVHHLIEALAGLHDTPFQFLLDEFADYRSPYEARLQELLVAHGLDQRVVRFDATHEEMPRYMNAADVVVVPSLSTPTWKEQYGRVAPEAMACGRAVIVSNSGALPELVGSAGLVVPEGDVPSLRTAVRDLLLDEPRRTALGRAAARWARETASLDRQADLMEDVLRRAAPRSGSGSAQPPRS